MVKLPLCCKYEKTFSIWPWATNACRDRKVTKKASMMAVEWSPSFYIVVEITAVSTLSNLLHKTRSIYLCICLGQYILSSFIIVNPFHKVNATLEWVILAFSHGIYRQGAKIKLNNYGTCFYINYNCMMLISKQERLFPLRINHVTIIANCYFVGQIGILF